MAAAPPPTVGSAPLGPMVTPKVDEALTFTTSGVNELVVAVTEVLDDVLAVPDRPEMPDKLAPALTCMPT